MTILFDIFLQYKYLTILIDKLIGKNDVKINFIIKSL